MGRFVIAAAILLSCATGFCSTGFAQVTAPSMGTAMDDPALASMTDTIAPPPPGASAAAAALDGAGIPLAATDLFVGGLSPSPTDLGGCPGAAGVVALGTGAIFSGDGTLSISTSDLGGTAAAGGTGCSVAPTAGVGPLGLSSTQGAGASFGGGSIPLATTAVPTTGLAGPIASPGSITPCSSTGASVFAASPQSPLAFALSNGTPTGRAC
jgi:hypothetical protein